MEVTEGPEVPNVLEGGSIDCRQSSWASHPKLARPIMAQLPSHHWVPPAFPKLSLFSFIFRFPHLSLWGFLACI